MSPNGHGDRYLRFKQESHSIKLEIAGVFAALREVEMHVRAKADAIKKDPATWNIDTHLLAEEVRQAGDSANRYRELLALDADSRAAIEKFESNSLPNPL